jgi:HAD superfamily hydrolase (TIGR01509 family)
MNQLFGVAFDIDGTIIDNNHYHYLAFVEFYKKRNQTLTKEEFIKNFNGKTNADVMKYVFQKELPVEEVEHLTDEKESIYRKIYATHIKPVKGLLELLENLKVNNIPMAIATSGIPVNIEFMFQRLSIQHYFKAVINSTHITNGKPHPEIYQLAAKKLGLKPVQCLAFEDSVSGIASAKAAGLKVIALRTTETNEKLKNADLIVRDFSEVTVEKIKNLISTG